MKDGEGKRPNGSKSAGLGNGVEEGPKLRHEFVALLFALATGEVGLQLVDVLKEMRAGEPHLAASSHLLLMTVLIAASWVGWSTTRATGAQHDTTRVFSWNFAILLLDVTIVIAYFVMVRNLSYGVEQLAGRDTLTLAIVFALYVLWDLFVNKGSLSKSLVSIGCLVFSVAAVFGLHGVRTDGGVALCDLALLGLALLFRAWVEAIPAGETITAKGRLGKLRSGRCLAVLLISAALGIAARLAG